MGRQHGTELRVIVPWDFGLWGLGQRPLGQRPLWIGGALCHSKEANTLLAGDKGL